MKIGFQIPKQRGRLTINANIVHQQRNQVEKKN